MRILGRRTLLVLGQAGVNGVALPGMRTAFDVRMSRASVPDTAQIRLWNPGAATRAALTGPRPTCMLHAGYDDAEAPANPAPPPIIFLGDVQRWRITRAGADSILELECQAGGRTWQHGRVLYSTVAPTSLASLIPIAAAQVGLGIYSVVTVQQVPLPHGAYVDEPFRDFMDRVAASLGVTWSVTDGLLMVAPMGVPTPYPTSPVFSSASANLIGSPRPTERNGIEIRGLLDPAMRPGRTFVVASPTQSGAYIAQDVRFHGDSGYDQPFYVEIMGRLPGTA